MEYLLWLTRTRRSAYLSDLAKYKQHAIALFGVVAFACVAFVLSRPAAPPDLAQGRNARNAEFNLHWAKGDLIVLVRHVERCDHSTAPCLGAADGITARGKDVAQAVGLHFQKLGLERTDIYSSPLTRAAQTSKFMFNYASLDQGWLTDCRKTMLSDALKHKVKDRNLILVTHSECITQLEKSLELSSPQTRDYGSSLFITVDEKEQQPHALGYIDANDWPKVQRN